MRCDLVLCNFQKHWVSRRYFYTFLAGWIHVFFVVVATFMLYFMISFYEQTFWLWLHLFRLTAATTALFTPLPEKGFLCCSSHVMEFWGYGNASSKSVSNQPRTRKIFHLRESLKSLHFHVNDFLILWLSLVLLSILPTFLCKSDCKNNAWLPWGTFLRGTMFCIRSLTYVFISLFYVSIHSGCSYQYLVHYRFADKGSKKHWLCLFAHYQVKNSVSGFRQLRHTRTC